MGCFWGHKWEKWTEPKLTTVSRYYFYSGQTQDRDTFTQKRTCKKCGIQEWRAID